MGVADSHQFVGHDFINFAIDRLDECRVFDGRVDWDILLSLDRIADIDADDSLGPLFKLGHLLPRELVPVARDVHGAIIIHHEFGILVAPPIHLEPLLFVSDGLIHFDLLTDEGE